MCGHSSRTYFWSQNQKVVNMAEKVGESNVGGSRCAPRQTACTCGSRYSKASVYVNIFEAAQ